ncbi:hypothetical protein Rxyl_2700 [Rubrobacter xylanophilus DSM 9941]|uniref:Gram-positive cocci surface proteins LPxTG domain-containing protein n=1 Tax=Rubrobacter xylanophilus (strain DSM 9941 / JCM 11954 / NBRC 16129 / PRD-1) TaxID=266117 RepID=Q1ASL1_RUBXD|nr:LPXTG cell wall anchor domain-containing protein [Rubrobacter xylanophilus]ABG05617.1 hypothetical protein Rxyl_2700 [Rubrobacter xylanophilus DSM 9941]
MRKVVLLAAMLAMALFAAAPVLAQANAVGGDVQIQDQDCAQVISVLGQQAQYGDAGAVSGDIGSAAAADIAQELGISVDAVQNCLQAGDDINLEQGGTVVVHPGHDDGGDVHGDDNGGTSSEDGATASASASAAAATGGVLPETGGASLIALGAGALLVAGGLLARRIIR